jgi:hypothetical protein
MEKDSENNFDSSDKDYGFPFVKVEPLQSSAPQEISQPSGDITEIEPLQKENLTDQSSVPTAIKFESAQITERKKKSQVPLLFSLILLILIVLASMAYFLYYLPEGENGQQVANEEVKSSQNESALVNNELSAAGAEVMGEEVEKEVTTEVQEPEVAPTSAELILIRDREVKPYYYIVVSSMISESIARSEAEKLIGMDKNTWIIFPYEDVKNYRIAVGKFDNINTATEAWETAKGEFGDATWILKY